MFNSSIKLFNNFLNNFACFLGNLILLHKAFPSKASGITEMTRKQVA